MKTLLLSTLSLLLLVSQPSLAAPAQLTARASDNGIISLKKIGNTPYNLDLNFHYHNFDTSMPMIGSASFQRGIQGCRAGIDNLIARGGSSARPSPNQQYYCGDQGVQGQENGWRMTLGPYFQVQPRDYPTWETVRTTIDGVNVGMLNTGNLFANQFYVYVPGGLLGLGKRRDVIAGSVQIVWQGVVPSGGRGPSVVSKRGEGGKVEGGFWGVGEGED